MDESFVQCVINTRDEKVGKGVSPWLAFLSMLNAGLPALISLSDQESRLARGEGAFMPAAYIVSQDDHITLRC